MVFQQLTSNAHVITQFRGRYEFLSNFHPIVVSYAGHDHRSVEHAYQFSKTIDPDERRLFYVSVTTAADAKRRGKNLTLRRDWEDVKEMIMLDLLRKKFSDSRLRGMLIATGDDRLVERNWWGDTYWGVNNIGEGMNRLGVLLMQVREEIKDAKTADERVL